MPALDITSATSPSMPGLVQDPNHKHLARSIGDPGRIEGAGCLVWIVRYEVDEALPLTTLPLDRFDVDSGITQNRAEASQGARGVL
jgi:hypothetical protein